MISSMVCCIATCAMIPAAPARSAGLVRSDPGPANWTNPLIWPLFPFSTPVLRLVFELFLSPVLAGKLRGLLSQGGGRHAGRAGERPTVASPPPNRPLAESQ